VGDAHENAGPGAHRDDHRVRRGGSWINDARNARAAYRNHDDPSNAWNNQGFRFSRAHERVHPPLDGGSAAAPNGGPAPDQGVVRSMDTRLARPVAKAKFVRPAACP
jgi:hypothetical protein